MLAQSPEAAAMLRLAARSPLVAAADRRRGPTLDRLDVERLIPHRDPFLFVDRVEYLDRSTSTIVCQYDLRRAASIVAGHFPGRPIWPGVLQVEAIGQAGLCLAMLMREAEGTAEPSGLVLSHILGAEFVRPVLPGPRVEVVARALSDGLFDIFVGQCLQEDHVCSAAAVRGTSEGRTLRL
jgi:3-hydroxyacyl-[acyl-carrier-protein] dehydratase